MTDAIEPIGDADLIRAEHLVKASVIDMVHLTTNTLWSFIARIRAAERIGAEHLQAALDAQEQLRQSRARRVELETRIADLEARLKPSTDASDEGAPDG